MNEPFPGYYKTLGIGHPIKADLLVCKHLEEDNDGNCDIDGAPCIGLEKCGFIW